MYGFLYYIVSGMNLNSNT